MLPALVSLSSSNLWTVLNSSGNLLKSMSLTNLYKPRSKLGSLSTAGFISTMRKEAFLVFRKLLSQPLDAQLTERLIAVELRRIIENCDPESVYLFGSAARGEMTDASDLDFLVVLPDFADVKGLKSRYYRSSVERTVPVDAVFVKRSEFEKRSRVGGLCFVVAEEGKLLYSTKSESQKNG